MLRDNIVHKQRTVDGVSYFYDAAREKWLSVGMFCVSYGINHRSINCSRWMAISNGIYSNNIGFRTCKLSTIVTITPQSKNQSMCTFNVAGINNILITVALSNESYGIFNTNIDFDENEVLKCFLEINNGYKVDFPFISLECAYRLP